MEDLSEQIIDKLSQRIDEQIKIQSEKDRNDMAEQIMFINEKICILDKWIFGSQHDCLKTFGTPNSCYDDANTPASSRYVQTSIKNSDCNEHDLSIALSALDTSRHHTNPLERKIKENFKSFEGCHWRSKHPSTAETVVDFSFVGSCDDAKERSPVNCDDGRRVETT